MATNTDGSVIIGVDLSLTQAEKQLKKLEGDIDKTGEKINDLTNKRDQAQQDGIFQSGVLDEEKMKLEEIKSRLKEARAIASDKSVDAETRKAFKEMVPNISTELSEQQKRVRMLQTEYNQTENAVKKYGDQIINANMELDKQKAAAGQLAADIDKANSPAKRFKRHMEETGEGVEKVENRLKRLATRVMIFSVFTMGLRELRKWMMSAIKTNDEARQSMAQLKGALLTMVQPLVNVVIPAFITLVKVLTAVVTTIAKVVSSIFGSTVEQSAEAAENLNDEQKALKGVGAEAKKAGKSLASFDEINKLSDNKDAGTGAKGQDEIAPDFSGMVGSQIGEIETIVGGALLAVGALLTFSGINVPLGLTMMALGAAALYSYASENWDSLSEKLQGPIGIITAIVSGALLVLGAILAFSGTNIPLGIALMAAGAAGLATTVAANWKSIQPNIKQVITEILLLAGTALLAFGMLFAFTGNLPLGLALIAAGLASYAGAAMVDWNYIVTSLQGPLGGIMALLSTALLVIGAILAFSGPAHMGLGIALMAAGAVGLATVIAINWDNIPELLRGPVGIVTAVISGALLVLGAILAFSGANIPLGIGMMVAGAVGLATVVSINWNSIVESMQGPVGLVTALVGGALVAFGAILAFSGANVPLGIGMMVAGGLALATAIAPNWNYILDKLKGAWEAIKKWWSTTAVPGLKSIPNFFINNVINKLLGGAEGFINFFIDGINALISKLNSFGIDIPDILGGGKIGFNIGKLGNVTLPRVPALAQGAVIPPNREFMAVLGDQTSGNNIETPEGLLRQIVREESGGNNYTNILQQILAAIKEGKVMVVDQTVFAQLISASSDSERFRRGDPMVTVH